MSYTGVIPSTTDTPRPRQDEAAVSSAVLASGGTTPRLRFVDTADALPEPAAVMVWPQGTPLLAELVALFADLGLRVASHEQLPAGEPGSPLVHRFDFSTGDFAWDAETPGLLSDAFEAAAAGHLEVDGFTRLVAAANLTWTDAVLVRAACRYLRQVGLGLSEPNIVAILLRHSDFVRGFRDLFTARFDPAVTGPDRDSAVADAERVLLDAIDRTATLDEDRLLRGLLSFTSAVLRTNWFQHDRTISAAPAAFKIDPSLLSLSAAVTPYREIFVHSRDRRGQPRSQRSGLARRTAVVGPQGRLPHRGSGSDEDAAREELADRSDGREGRVRGAHRDDARRGPCGVHDFHRRTARRHRRHRRRRGRPPPRHGDLRRRRPVSGGGRRQGHGAVLRPGQQHRDASRLLARRRVRVRRLRRLRPQGDGHHGARRMGFRPQAFRGDGQERRHRRVHGGRHRRHVRRCVRQRDAAQPRHPAGRRVRPPAHLPRSRTGFRGVLPGARAPRPPCPAAAGTITTGASSRRAAACGRGRRRRSRCRRRCGNASASPPPNSRRTRW